MFWQIIVHTSIFTRMSTLSSDPVIAYFQVVWYKELSNEYENLSGLTIWDLQVDFARIVNFISISCNGILKVFMVSGTHLWPSKMPRIAIDVPHVIFFWKSQLYHLLLKSHIWGFLCNRNEWYIENKNSLTLYRPPI